MNGDLQARPLRADEWAAWRDVEMDDYARDIAENGSTEPDVARRKAERDMAEILPNGLDTANHWIYVLEHDDETVGRLWLAEREIDGRRSIFIFDIHIDEHHRGRGFGRAAMLIAECETRARGIHHMELNVFGGNRVARGLYQSLGYVERSVRMARDLE